MAVLASITHDHYPMLQSFSRCLHYNLQLQIYFTSQASTLTHTHVRTCMHTHTLETKQVLAKCDAAWNVLHKSMSFLKYWLFPIKLISKPELDCLISTAIFTSPGESISLLFSALVIPPHWGQSTKYC